jgi:hypothetical protein
MAAAAHQLDVLERKIEWHEQQAVERARRAPQLLLIRGPTTNQEADRDRRVRGTLKALIPDLDIEAIALDAQTIGHVVAAQTLQAEHGQAYLAAWMENLRLAPSAHLEVLNPDAWPEPPGLILSRRAAMVVVVAGSLILWAVIWGAVGLGVRSVLS